MSWGGPSSFSAWGTCANALPAHREPAVGPIGDFISEVVHPSAGASVPLSKDREGLDRGGLDSACWSLRAGARLGTRAAVMVGRHCVRDLFVSM